MYLCTHDDYTQKLADRARRWLLRASSGTAWRNFVKGTCRGVHNCVHVYRLVSVLIIHQFNLPLIILPTVEVTVSMPSASA